MTDQAISPVRRRMIEDLTIRKFAPKTQSSYIRAVRNFVIQVLLGHKKLDTTALYSQVATRTIREVKSPLEQLVMTPPA